MSPRFRTGLHAQAGAVFSFHPRLHAGDRPTAGRSRSATILPGDAAVSPPDGDHAGARWVDPTPPRHGPKHRGAGRSQSATAPLEYECLAAVLGRIAMPGSASSYGTQPARLSRSDPLRYDPS